MPLSIGVGIVFNFQFSIFNSYFVLLYNQLSEVLTWWLLSPHGKTYADIFDFGDFVRVICQRQPGAITDLSDFASIA